jgi:FkbM family methyltransferase
MSEPHNRAIDVQALVGSIPASSPRGDVAALTGWLSDPIVVVDAGCRWGFGEQWTALRPDVRLIGFDPDETECRRLEELYGDDLDATLVPIALGSSHERRSLRRFRFPAASSFHPHDEGALKHAAIPREGDVLEELVEVEVTTLDRWCAEHDLTRVDALKLDVQGHELEILRGAPERLTDVRAVELEVCLNPIMAGTPLFGEVDAFLRERGFYLWRLRDLAHYPVKGGDGVAGSIERVDHLSYQGFESIRWTSPPGFVSWGNAHYVRTELFDPQAELPWVVRLRDAVLMNSLRFHDLAAVSLQGALEASPPAVIAADIQDALEAATHVPPVTRPAPCPEARPPRLDAGPASASRPRPKRLPESGVWSRLRAVAKRPYRPLVWRLERNHRHAEWRADALGQQLGELGDRMEAIETSLHAMAARSPERSPLEAEVRQALAELRQTHALSNEAIVEWTAVIGRVLADHGDLHESNGRG